MYREERPREMHAEKSYREKWHKETRCYGPGEKAPREDAREKMEGEKRYC
jgi:hypothetical protein